MDEVFDEVRMLSQIQWSGVHQLMPWELHEKKAEKDTKGELIGGFAAFEFKAPNELIVRYSVDNDT